VWNSSVLHLSVLKNRCSSLQSLSVPLVPESLSNFLKFFNSFFCSGPVFCGQVGWRSSLKRLVVKSSHLLTYNITTGLYKPSLGLAETTAEKTSGTSFTSLPHRGRRRWTRTERKVLRAIQKDPLECLPPRRPQKGPKHILHSNTYQSTGSATNSEPSSPSEPSPPLPPSSKSDNSRFTL